MAVAYTHPKKKSKCLKDLRSFLKYLCRFGGSSIAPNDPQLCEGGDLKDKSLLNQKC
jgi:hypothetical protein